LENVGLAAVLMVAMMSWGLFDGLGFGAGLGLAFHLCQSRAGAAETVIDDG